MLWAFVASVLSWLPVNQRMRQQEERLAAWQEARANLNLAGFLPWTRFPPDKAATVWAQRVGEDTVQLITVRDLQPWFNVGDLWWKPAENGAMIDITPGPPASLPAKAMR